MKRLFNLFLLLTLVLSLGNICLADTTEIDVILNREIKVTYNDAIQEFQNVNGVKVYPLSYEGTTYLPIRSISSLFKSKIKWDGNTNSIYLGEGDLDTTSSKTVSSFIKGSNETIKVLLNRDIKIYYNDKVQTFTDVTGKNVYPLSYNGITYLPVRAVSNLFNLNIDWDGANNTVIIKDKVQETTKKENESDESQKSKVEDDSDKSKESKNENNRKKTESTTKTQYGNIEYYYSDDISKELNYLLYVPNSAGNKNLPLIIYLHGGSGRGNDLTKVEGGNSLIKYIKNGSLGDVSAYFLAPQCPANYNGWNEIANEVFALIEKVTQQNAIDKSKIILTGNSMGGAGTWNIALKNPELFSCIVPMSGKIQDSQENRKALVKTPIWAFVGENDTVVKPSYSINFCEGLKNTNPRVKYTVFENAEHSDVLKLAWLDKEIGLLDWMLSQ